ncbi:MAG: lanthionine synthetase LanC family protein, partial [Propionibacteriaceae bacterium]
MSGLELWSFEGPAEQLAQGAAEWLLHQLPELDVEGPSLYYGLAGVLLALREADQHFNDESYSRAVERAADLLSEQIDGLEDCSLYFGLAGVAVALRAVGRDEAADRALRRVWARFDGQRWHDMFELLGGNAGIGLGALQTGDLDLAVAAVEPYLTTADVTPGGVNWAVRPSPARSHHLAHGTLGIVYALAAVGEAAHRGDL